MRRILIFSSLLAAALVLTGSASAAKHHTAHANTTYDPTRRRGRERHIEPATLT